MTGGNHRTKGNHHTPRYIKQQRRPLNPGEICKLRQSLADMVNKHMTPQNNNDVKKPFGPKSG